MESADAQLLARLGRIARADVAGTYLDQIARVSQWCHDAGIRCRIFLMAGLPGQTPAAVDATVVALRRVAPSATLHPNVYRAYDGVGLEGYNQPVAPASLQALREANHPGPSLLSRTLGAARRRLQGAGTPSAPPASIPAEVRPAEAAAGAAASLEESARRHGPGEYLLAGSRVFLTGGSGFVGGYVAQALVAAGAEVVALLRPGAPPGALGGLPLRFSRGDLTEPSSWIGDLRGCRFCFHVAALYGGQDRAAAMYAVNARATGALLAACAEAGVARFIHTSTIGTVGRPSGGGSAALPDESTPFNLWEHGSHYVRSKRLGELLAHAWSGAGLDVVVVKPAAPVGARDGGAGRQPSATGRRILAALRGQPFSYPAGGINHAPVRDIAAGHLLAAQRGEPGHAYILGHAQGNLDRAAFVRLLGLPADPGAPSGAQPARVGPEALTADPRRAIRELGLPQSDLAAAFAEAAAWYRSGEFEEKERVVSS
jgi:dihydroflavonol-4-reductase